MAVEYVKVETEVPKEAYELSRALYNITAKAKEVTDNGWQTSEDLPQLLLTAATELVTALQGVEKMGDEAKASPALFAKAFALSGADVASLWVRGEQPVE